MRRYSGGRWLGGCKLEVSHSPLQYLGLVSIIFRGVAKVSIDILCVAPKMSRSGHEIREY